MIDEHFLELVQAFAFGVKVGAVSVGVPVVLALLVASQARLLSLLPTRMKTRLNRGLGRGGVR